MRRLCITGTQGLCGWVPIGLKARPSPSIFVCGWAIKIIDRKHRLTIIRAHRAEQRKATVRSRRLVIPIEVISAFPIGIAHLERMQCTRPSQHNLLNGQPADLLLSVIRALIDALGIEQVQKVGVNAPVCGQHAHVLCVHDFRWLLI